MRFFSTHDPKRAAMPDITSPEPANLNPPVEPGDMPDRLAKIKAEAAADSDDPARIDLEAHRSAGTRPDYPGDTGTRLQAPPQITDDREDCPVCHGTGKKLRCADYLAEIVGMLPADDPVAMDMIIADFYRHFMEAAPHLKVFFPADLTTGDALNSKGNKQRDQLLNALVLLLSRYDPDHPQSDGMKALRTNALTWGHSHTAWLNPETGEIYYPTPDDYLAVRNVLVMLLSGGLGDKLTSKHVAALARAYHSVSNWMQTSADEWRMEQGEPTVPRRPRPAAAR
jgi:hemoglobin-like flavoprotein